MKYYQVEIEEISQLNMSRLYRLEKVLFARINKIELGLPCTGKVYGQLLLLHNAVVEEIYNRSLPGLPDIEYPRIS